MPKKSIRARFVVHAVKKHMNYEGGANSVVVELSAVNSSAKENEVWAKYTPTGNLQMTITNEALFDAFDDGGVYWIDLTPVE